MGADVLATQGAKASATMILTILNQINSVVKDFNVYKVKFKFFIGIYTLSNTNDDRYSI